MSTPTVYSPVSPSCFNENQKSPSQETDLSFYKEVVHRMSEYGTFFSNFAENLSMSLQNISQYFDRTFSNNTSHAAQ